MRQPDPVRKLWPGASRPAADVPPQEMRSVMGQFATGVTVLTAGGELAHGMTLNAFTSVSLTPPLVLCCVATSARLHDAVLAAGSFAVSILAADQESVARYFADRSRPSGWAQFDAVGATTGQRTGAPLPDGALAWVECQLHAVYEGGDHAIFVGAVLACGRGTGEGALSFFGGSYHRIDLSAAPAARPPLPELPLKEAS